MSVPDTLGNRFVPLAPLGQGAMGEVWRVIDRSRGQEVALKTLRLDRGPAARSASQFKQEFRWMTQLLHPNCCEVHDYGVMPAGEPFFTMEVVEGKGLDELAPLPVRQVPGILAQLLLALGYVHQQGFIHRDVKSSNVRLKPDGTVKLMDFGLMGVAGQPTTAIAGTLAYLAPEAIRHAPLDRRADLYAVGVLAYELLTGAPPFRQASARELLQAHLHEVPPPPSALRPEVPPGLDAVVMRLMAKDPVQRYPSAAAVLADLGAEVPAGFGGSLLRSPLVGREDEGTRLAGRVARIEAGQAGGAVLVLGPAGIGKTRLVNDLRVAAQLGEIPCAMGAYVAASKVPYPAFVGVLRTLLPVMRAEIPGTLEALAPVLVKLLPELGCEPAAELDGGGQDEARLHRAIAEALAGLALARPFVIILEDLQWAAPRSLDLLKRLLPELERLPVLVAITSREVPAAMAPWEALVEQVALPRLGPDALRHMVGAMLGLPTPPAALVQEVERATGGNPFYVERFLDYMVRHGLLRPAGGGWELAAGHDQALPGDLLALVLGDLADLPAEARDVAEAIAVAAIPLDLEALGRMTDLPDGPLLDALLALQTRGVLQGGASYHFAHDHFRATIDAAIAPARRKTWHDAAAAALAAGLEGLSLEEAPLDVLAALARHGLEGEEPSRGVPAALMAGRRHAALFASDEAGSYLRAALAAMDADPVPEAWEASRVDALQALGQIQVFLGDLPEARRTLAAGAIRARARDATGQAAEILTSLARVDLALDDPATARQGCDEALALAGSGPLAIETLLTRARVHAATGAASPALADLTRALDLARAAGAATAEGHALVALGRQLMEASPALASVAVDHFEAAIGRLAADDKLGLGTAYGELGWAQARLGRFEAATEAQTNLLMTSLEIGHPDGYVRSLVALAELAWAQGDAAEAEKMLGDALRGATGGPEALGLALLARVQAEQGRFADAAAATARLAVALPKADGRLVAEALAARADVLVALGDLAGAAEANLALGAAIRSTGQAWCRPWHLAIGLALAVRGGTAGPAPADLEAILPTALALERLRGLEALAAAALQAEAWDEVLRHGEAGLALARELGTRSREARLELVLAERALAVGVPGAAASFERVEAWALQACARELAALAAFGRAATAPYDPEAIARAEAAGTQLRAMAAALDPGLAEAFLATPERRRVLEGNFLAFGLPRLRERGTRPLAPEGSGFPGLWQM